MFYLVTCVVSAHSGQHATNRKTPVTCTSLVDTAGINIYIPLFGNDRCLYGSYLGQTLHNYIIIWLTECIYCMHCSFVMGIFYFNASLKIWWRRLYTCMQKNCYLMPFCSDQTIVIMRPIHLSCLHTCIEAETKWWPFQRRHFQINVP